MSSLSFARIMYGSTEDLHSHVATNLSSRPAVIGMRSAAGSPGEASPANPSVGKLLRFARLFLDGKAE
jgi:hypothetical protein